MRLDNTHRPPFPTEKIPHASAVMDPANTALLPISKVLGRDFLGGQRGMKRPNDHGWKKSAKNEQQETTWKKMESSNLPNSFRNFQNTFLPNLDFYGRIQLSFLFRSSFAPTR